MKIKLPYVLLILYIIVFIALGINPYDRAVWFAENLPIMLIVLILAFTYKKYQFSNTAYILMSFLIFLHTIGGHYTFARVPFGFISELFGFERNHFDRMAHFTVGFFAFGFCEILLRKKLVNSKFVLLSFGILAILSVAAGYEIFEWQFAVLEDGEAGIEVLGSQGDIWDAQKDMLADGLGAVFATILFWLVNRKNILKLGIKNKNGRNNKC
jgi:putative membrane protein